MKELQPMLIQIMANTLIDRSWTVDEDKMALTNNAYFMHCLPVKTEI